MNERQTVAGAYTEAAEAKAELKAHEDLCAERYDRINETLGDLKAGQKQHGRAAWGIVLALLSWMALQVWNGQVAHPAPAESHATAR